MAGGRQLHFIYSVNTEVQLRKQLKSFTNNYRETKNDFREMQED